MNEEKIARRLWWIGGGVATLAAAAGLVVSYSLYARWRERADAEALLKSVDVELVFDAEPHFLEWFGGTDLYILRPVDRVFFKPAPRRRPPLDGRIGRALATFSECQWVSLDAALVGPGFLIELRRIPALVGLELRYCNLDDSHCLELPELDSVRYLTLHSNADVTDVGAVRLGGMASLEALDLSDTHVGDAALAAPFAPKLRALDVGGTRATAQGVAALAAWPALEEVGAFGLGIPPDGPALESLRAAGKSTGGVDWSVGAIFDSCRWARKRRRWKAARDRRPPRKRTSPREAAGSKGRTARGEPPKTVPKSTTKSPRPVSTSPLRFKLRRKSRATTPETLQSPETQGKTYRAGGPRSAERRRSRV